MGPDETGAGTESAEKRLWKDGSGDAGADGQQLE